MQERLGHENNFNLIRLVAAFQVLLVHAAIYFGLDGFLFTCLKLVPGVPVFFFVSGYLIHGAYERTRKHGVTAFFVNRALRIYPAMLVCFVASVLLVYLSGYFATHESSPVGFVVWLLSQITVLQIYHPGFMREFGTGVLNAPLWTVVVELQFYALTPVLCCLLQRRKWAAGLLFGASLFANLGLRIYMDWDVLWFKALYVSFLPWIYMFMSGALFAEYGGLRRLATNARAWYLLPTYVASLALLGSYHANASNSIHPLGFFLLALGTFKVGQAALPAYAEKLLSLVRRHDISYGLYLYHMPIINALLYVGLIGPVQNTCITVLGSLAAAVASWCWIEKPALRFKQLATRDP